MGKISKPDANPVVALLITWFIFGLGHLLINGQQKKWLMIFIAHIIGTFLCVFPGIIIHILSIIDSYQTAERLKAGETIDDNEYTLVPLYKIIKLIDKTATCSKAV